MVLKKDETYLTLVEVTYQIKKFVGTANALMERYARSMEEIDSTRLANEELREQLREQTEEFAHWADRLQERMNRLEQYTVLSKIGNQPHAAKIEATVNREHEERALREDLTHQRELWSQYQKNLDRVKLRIARDGETTGRMNEAEEYEQKIRESVQAIENLMALLNIRS